MPYGIEKVGDGRFKVVNKDTGAVHSKGTTKANAEAQVRLLRGVEHGMKPQTTSQAAGITQSRKAKSKGKSKPATTREATFGRRRRT